MIHMDFDKKNEKGEKDFLLNAKAASIYPETYAELSKGGHGIHLTYYYSVAVKVSLMPASTLLSISVVFQVSGFCLTWKLHVMGLPTLECIS